MDAMDMTRFRYVEAIAELKNFTRAAEKLYISQPALTKSIAKLERELGVKLFDRSTTPIQLTYAGERYLAGMKNISAMRYQLGKELEDIANMRKERLRIGIPSTRSQRWLSAILPIFLRERPGIDLHIQEVDSTELLEHKLSQGLFDLSIISTLPMTTPGLDYEVICDEQLTIVASPKHPIFSDIDLSQIDLKQPNLHYINPERLQNQPYIASMPEQGLCRAANQLFELFSIHPNKVMEISNTSTARKLAKDNLGFVVTAAHSVLNPQIKLDGVICCTITDPATVRSVIVSYKKGQPLSPAAHCFIDVIKRVYRSNPELQTVHFPVVHDLGD